MDHNLIAKKKHLNKLDNSDNSLSTYFSGYFGLNYNRSSLDKYNQNEEVYFSQNSGIFFE